VGEGPGPGAGAGGGPGKGPGPGGGLLVTVIRRSLWALMSGSSMVPSGRQARVVLPLLRRAAAPEPSTYPSWAADPSTVLTVPVGCVVCGTVSATVHAAWQCCIPLYIITQDTLALGSTACCPSGWSKQSSRRKQMKHVCFEQREHACSAAACRRLWDPPPPFHTPDAKSIWRTTIPF
jgi:hypothetical protein